MAGIYLHIPFCTQRCIYCDFFSSTHTELKKEYVDALCRELVARKQYIKEEIINTLYFGGGTPSQLNKEELERIFTTLYAHFSIAEQAEITLEANPDDLTQEYIDMLRTHTPINRLSVGIQSFNDERLRFLNRRHTSQEAIQAIKRCQQSGFNNISIDLIYGFPRQNKEEWQYDLSQAIELNVPHISAYHLIYEEETTLWRMREAGKVEEIDEDLSVSLFEQLIDELEKAGIQQYEISNFSRPGWHSRHNSSYWDGTLYLGAGAGAHSYNGTCRHMNVNNLQSYISNAKREHFEIEAEHLDHTTRYNEKIIISLRTMKGLDLKQLRRSFGSTLYSYCMKNARPFIESKALELLYESNAEEPSRVKLTRKGIFISDEIMNSLMWVD